VENVIALGMKPGTWGSLFCSDAGGLDGSGVPAGYTSCLGGSTNPNNDYLGFYFDTMQQAVANAYGHYPGATPGPLAIPEELAGPNFYFKAWMVALDKYLQTAGNPATPLATVAANAVDFDDLDIQSLNGSFVTGNYIDRTTVNSSGEAPTQINVATSLASSLINNFAFTRLLLRGELALYTALKDIPSDQPGAEPLLLQNMVGSPVLVGAYGSYACAVGAIGSGCNAAQVPPTDPLTGQSVFAPYQDAFGTSIFTLPSLGGLPNASGIAVDSADYASIASASITVPIYTPPYGVGSGATSSGSITELVPFASGAGVGIPVTIAGADQLYAAQEFDLSGYTMSASVYFQPSGGGTPTAVIRGVASSGYLGRVFPCFEQSPTVAGTYDVLSVRMYDDVADVTSWIAAHTFGSANPIADCGIQVINAASSTDGGAPVPMYITFGVNPSLPIGGVRLSITPGFGGSYVGGVVMFDPTIVSSL